MPPWAFFLGIVNVSALGWIAHVAGWSFLFLMAVIAVENVVVILFAAGWHIYRDRWTVPEALSRAVLQDSAIESMRERRAERSRH